MSGGDYDNPRLHALLKRLRDAYAPVTSIELATADIAFVRVAWTESPTRNPLHSVVIEMEDGRKIGVGTMKMAKIKTLMSARGTINFQLDVNA